MPPEQRQGLNTVHRRVNVISGLDQFGRGELAHHRIVVGENDFAGGLHGAEISIGGRSAAKARRRILTQTNLNKRFRAVFGEGN